MIRHIQTIKVIILINLIVSLSIADSIIDRFSGEIFPFETSRTILSSVCEVLPEDMPILPTSNRIALGFDYPEAFFSDTNAIVEAYLVVRVVSDVVLEDNRTIGVVCYPLFVDGLPTPELTNISDSGLLNRETGEVLLRLKDMLQYAADNNREISEFIIAPANNDPSFHLSTLPEPANMKCEFRQGMRIISH